VKLIDVHTHVISDAIRKEVSITISAHLEDDIQDHTISHELSTTVTLTFDTDDFDAIDLAALQYLTELIREHPFYKLRLCESPIELRFFYHAMHDVPGIEPQVEEGPYRIDLAVPEKKIAIELNGHEFHKSRRQRTDDAKRERYLQRQGWKVIRFTGTEVHADVMGCIEEAKQIIAGTPDCSAPQNLDT